MAQLLDLSPELLRHIVLMLAENIASDYWDNGADLYQLAQTCHTFHQITGPFLYTKFVQIYGPSQVRKFLRTVLARPDLAAQVKTVWIHQHQIDSWQKQVAKIDSEDERDDKTVVLDRDRIMRREHRRWSREVDAVIKAFEDLDIITEDREVWISAITARDHDAIAAVLLLYLPNIEELSIMFDSNKSFEEEQGFLSDALSKAIKNKNASSPGRFFNSLQHVVYREDFPEGAIEMAEVDHFFYLPSLRTLSVTRLSVEQLIWDPPLLSSNIEELELTYSAVDNSAWATLLRPLQNLKRLSFIAGIRTNFMTITPSVMVQSLSVVKNTLESLVLNQTLLEENQNPVLLNGLRGFPVLRDLNVHLALLIGTEQLLGTRVPWESLPSSLDTLQVWGRGRSYGWYSGSKDRTDYIVQLVKFVRIKESHFPLLRKLTLNGGLNMAEELEEACERNGVSYLALELEYFFLVFF